MIHFNRLFLSVFLMVVVGYASMAHAGGDNTIYRHRIDFVEIESMPKKVVEEAAPNHPFTQLTVDQMKGMLLSLRISKRHLIKKQINDQQIFMEEEAEKFAPYLVEAFKRVSPDEWVAFSIIQKRPFFILRNDLLTLAHLWVEGDQLHVRFDKLYTKMIGDYESPNPQEKRVRQQLEGVSFSLEAGPGQVLSDQDPKEVLLDTHFDYASWWATVPKSQSGEADMDAPLPTAKTREDAGSAKGAKTAKERLQELDQLRKDGLVTKDEYETIRKSILSGI